MGEALFKTADFATLADRVGVVGRIGYSASQIFYVHNTGSSTNDGLSRSTPLSTVAGAVAKCDAAKGDVIFVMAGHTETLGTTAPGLDVDVAGIAILGEGHGKNRPVITAGAADIDAVRISASNVFVDNLWFVGSSSQSTNTSSLVDLPSGSDDVTFRNCVFDLTGLAAPTDVVRLAGNDRCKFLDCTWIGDTDGPDIAILITAASTHLHVIGCEFNFAPNGIDEAVIKVSAGAPSGLIVKDCLLIGPDLLAIDIDASGAATGDGLVTDCRIAAGAAVATIANLLDVGGVNFCNILATDTAAEEGSGIPKTTSA